MTPPNRWRNTCISIFVILWLFVFHYESLRFFYLNPLFGSDLPKIKFLFPPAGWIMFYAVDNAFGFTEVYGMKGEDVQALDPHDIFRVRTIGFDNIHRGILGSVAGQSSAYSFCNYLKRRYPYFDQFMVVAVYYPSLTEEPFKRFKQIQYQCVAREAP